MNSMNARRTLKVILLLALALTAALLLAGRLPGDLPKGGELDVKETGGNASVSGLLPAGQEQAPGIDRNGIYTSREDVAAYLRTYGRLPGNFITKAQARVLGWRGGDLRPYDGDACIGGDIFGNYEGLLPAKAGRIYYECDVDTLHAGSRGAKRIVYSNDGLIYFTGDHYSSFTLLSGEDGHAED